MITYEMASNKHYKHLQVTLRPSTMDKDPHNVYFTQVYICRAFLFAEEKHTINNFKVLLYCPNSVSFQSDFSLPQRLNMMCIWKWPLLQLTPLKNDLLDFLLNCTFQIVSTLIKHGIKMDARDSDGKTPLHVAAE